MKNLLLYLDPESSLSLQAQIRSRLIDSILAGQIPAGVRIPSTRQMAKQLGVSRNTVIGAIQDLIAEGYLISRERSGCYVNEAILDRFIEAGKREPASSDTGVAWETRIRPIPSAAASAPGNWQQYPYTFIDGEFDPGLFPVPEWRECTRISLGVREINAWASDNADSDDALLVEQIRSTLLPLRGINAQPDEILVTTGAQNSLALATQLLLSGKRIGVESPGYMNAWHLFETFGAELETFAVDKEGVVPDDRIADCDALYVTPSHQFPTTATMSMARRRQILDAASTHDFVILEDDYTQESNFISRNSPALKSMDHSGRVIYISSLSKVLAPGVRLGYMVAPAPFIRAARELRRLTSLHPANNNQHAAGLFLSLGHYDALLRRLEQVHKQRWLELRQAVNYCFPQPHFMITRGEGGTACWIEGPDDLDVFDLVEKARQQGILLDAPATYLPEDHQRNCFRLSVTSIDSEKIRPGLEALRDVINGMLSGDREVLSNARGRRLSEDELRQAIPGAALIGKTAYGDAYTVRMHACGKIDIAYDNAGQDTDTGRWWIENGQWWRQFTHSTYGEPRGFHVVLDGNVVKWFDSAGDLVDTELFIENYEDPVS